MGHGGAGQCTSSMGSVCSPRRNPRQVPPTGATTGATPHFCISHLDCGANRQTLKGTGPASELSACMNPQWLTSPPASELCPAHSYPSAACSLQPVHSGCDCSHVRPAPLDDIIIIIIIIINGNTSGSARLAGWLVGLLVVVVVVVGRIYQQY